MKIWEWIKEHVRPIIKPSDNPKIDSDDGHLDWEDIEKQAKRTTYGISFIWRF